MLEIRLFYLIVLSIASGETDGHDLLDPFYLLKILSASIRIFMMHMYMDSCICSSRLITILFKTSICTSSHLLGALPSSARRGGAARPRPSTSVHCHTPPRTAGSDNIVPVPVLDPLPRSLFGGRSFSSSCSYSPLFLIDRAGCHCRGTVDPYRYLIYMPWPAWIDP